MKNKYLENIKHIDKQTIKSAAQKQYDDCEKLCMTRINEFTDYINSMKATLNTEVLKNQIQELKEDLKNLIEDEFLSSEDIADYVKDEQQNDDSTHTFADNLINEEIEYIRGDFCNSLKEEIQNKVDNLYKIV